MGEIFNWILILFAIIIASTVLLLLLLLWHVVMWHSGELEGWLSVDTRARKKREERMNEIFYEISWSMYIVVSFRTHHTTHEWMFAIFPFQRHRSTTTTTTNKEGCYCAKTIPHHFGCVCVCNLNRECQWLAAYMFYVLENLYSAGVYKHIEQCEIV